VSSHNLDPAVPPGYEPIGTSGAAQSFENFVGPIYRANGATANEVGFAFRVAPHHCNPYGVLHGGMLATVVDTMMGYLVFHALKGGPCATISMTCDYIAAARAGDWAEGRATVTRMGRAVAFVRSEMRVGDKILLTASGSWAILPQRS